MCLNVWRVKIKNIKNIKLCEWLIYFLTFIILSKYINTVHVRKHVQIIWNEKKKYEFLTK